MDGHIFILVFIGLLKLSQPFALADADDDDVGAVTQRIPFENARVKYHRSRYCITSFGQTYCVRMNREPGSGAEIAKMYSIWMQGFDENMGPEGAKLLLRKMLRVLNNGKEPSLISHDLNKAKLNYRATNVNQKVKQRNSNQRVEQRNSNQRVEQRNSNQRVKRVNPNQMRQKVQLENPNQMFKLVDPNQIKEIFQQDNRNQMVKRVDPGHMMLNVQQGNRNQRVKPRQVNQRVRQVNPNQFRPNQRGHVNLSQNVQKNWQMAQQDRPVRQEKGHVIKPIVRAKPKVRPAVKWHVAGGDTHAPPIPR